MRDIPLLLKQTRNKNYLPHTPSQGRTSGDGEWLKVLPEEIPVE
jgi:hypothetical protein